MNFKTLKIKVMNLFRQRKTTLFNGKEVREGDNVYFIGSDGNRREFKIERRLFNYTHPDNVCKLNKGTLFLCNARFKITDYKNADTF